MGYTSLGGVKRCHEPETTRRIQGCTCGANGGRLELHSRAIDKSCLVEE